MFSYKNAELINFSSLVFIVCLFDLKQSLLFSKKSIPVIGLYNTS